VDSKRAYLEALNVALAAIGLEISSVDTKVAMEVLKRLEQGLPIDAQIKGIDVQTFLKVYPDAYYQYTSTKTIPLPNISETLRKLSEKARLALITTRCVPREKIFVELEGLGLAKHF
jgi:phosphoglycolate phosphatase-like HAD superfamily hydrolase